LEPAPSFSWFFGLFGVPPPYFSPADNGSPGRTKIDHDIRLKALKDLGDPLIPVAPVHSPTLVDIVSHYPKKSGFFLPGFGFRIRLLKLRRLGHRSLFHGIA
jgi:hypothetical protein